MAHSKVTELSLFSGNKWKWSVCAIDTLLMSLKNQYRALTKLLPVPCVVLLFAFGSVAAPSSVRRVKVKSSSSITKGGNVFCPFPGVISMNTPFSYMRGNSRNSKRLWSCLEFNYTAPQGRESPVRASWFVVNGGRTILKRLWAPRITLEVDEGLASWPPSSCFLSDRQCIGISRNSQVAGASGQCLDSHWGLPEQLFSA